MDEFSKRFGALTPEQREILALRLKKRGVQGLPVYEQEPPASAPAPGDHSLLDIPLASARRSMRFSLFFFSDNGTTTDQDKYRLLIESAVFADQHGFTAIWTPERHFQDFGGLYPNPAVISAALAVLTRNIQIRAGSVALPLHNPLRVAEDWALIDNLSNGRVGVSFASGWHPRDYILAPQNYDDRKRVMLEYIALIRRLWAGEPVTLPDSAGNDHSIRVYPRPIQPELPIWLASASSAATWEKAGEIGAHVLAALTDPLPELARKISLFRDARARSGLDPEQGQVALMVHTYLGENDEAIKDQARGPLSHYLSTFMGQNDNMPTASAADQIVTKDDKQAIIAHALERYVTTNALIGTPDTCARLVETLLSIGVDEIACLIDFGLDSELVLRGLPHLSTLQSRYV